MTTSLHFFIWQFNSEAKRKGGTSSDELTLEVNFSPPRALVLKTNTYSSTTGAIKESGFHSQVREPTWLVFTYIIIIEITFLGMICRR
jgi:hypothetical protein